MRSIVWLTEDSPITDFPDVETALLEPNGLLAAGGDLSTARLIEAYRNGIFPWYGDGQPILWWSPDPRMVLVPSDVHLSRKMRSFIRKTKDLYQIRFNTVFETVIHECAAPRDYSDDTWITDDMLEAYCELHKQGHAHCLEVWNVSEEQEKLVAGIYGIAIGKIFFGESMFSHESNTSKLAFIALAMHLDHWGYQLLDGQVESEHLRSLGCSLLPREEFSVILRSACAVKMSHVWEVIPEILVT